MPDAITLDYIADASVIIFCGFGVGISIYAITIISQIREVIKTLKQIEEIVRHKH